MTSHLITVRSQDLLVVDFTTPGSPLDRFVRAGGRGWSRWLGFLGLGGGHLCPFLSRACRGGGGTLASTRLGASLALASTLASSATATSTLGRSSRPGGNEKRLVDSLVYRGLGTNKN